MGYFIKELPDGRVLPTIGKALFLERFAGAERTDPILKENLVCVVNNGHFDAAGYIFDEKELQRAIGVNDNRLKIWLIVPDAAKLSGYTKQNI